MTPIIQVSPGLTFDLLLLPPGIGLLEVIEPRGRIPTAGDIVRAGKPGEGPGSMPGDRRAIERCEADGCIMAGFSRVSTCVVFNLMK